MDLGEEIGGAAGESGGLHHCYCRSVRRDIYGLVFLEPTPLTLVALVVYHSEREVFEETGVRANFESLLTVRVQHGAAFGEAIQL